MHSNLRFVTPETSGIAR